MAPVFHVFRDTSVLVHQHVSLLYLHYLLDSWTTLDPSRDAGMRGNHIVYS